MAVIGNKQVKATPEYLAEVRAEISRIKALPKKDACKVGLSLLKTHENELAVELRDERLGICLVTFHWSLTHSRSEANRTYLKVPKSELKRLGVLDDLCGLVGVGLDNKSYYFASGTFYANSFYAARDKEGRPVRKVPEVVLRDSDPVKHMVHLSELQEGTVTLVRGKKVYSPAHR